MLASMAEPLTLAASLGDPAGIGPELLCEAWVQRNAQRLAPFFVVGSVAILAAAAAARGLTVPLRAIDSPDQAARRCRLAAGGDGRLTPHGLVAAIMPTKRAISIAVSVGACGANSARVATAELAVGSRPNFLRNSNGGRAAAASIQTMPRPRANA